MLLLFYLAAKNNEKHVCFCARVTQVLVSMEKNASQAPRPFPLSDQYLPQMDKRNTKRKAPELEHSTVSGLCEMDKKKAKNSGGQEVNNPPAVAEKSVAAEGYRSCKYNSVFRCFLEKAKPLPYKERLDLWRNSSAKRELLKDMSLSELRKRRFIGKGVQANPWATKND